jgi:hypothetical protein
MASLFFFSHQNLSFNHMRAQFILGLVGLDEVVYLMMSWAAQNPIEK